MRNRTSQLIRLLFSNKKILLPGIFLVVILALVPFAIAHASLGSTIANAIADSVFFLIEKGLSIVAEVNGFIFSGVATAMTAVIKYFMSMTVTPGAPNTPSFVSETWNMVRQLTNIFFILILVFIGLATILRLASYQMKQTLPLLLIMALLVNFSGVFVGFIVDISNLVTNYFLDQASAFKELGSIQRDFTATGGATESIAKIAKHISAIIYYLVATLIFLILMFVFMIRTWFLWLIVILSPLAFASYILPATRSKIWSKWWEQLIQWSFFAIPVAFTLWLARAALTISGDSTKALAPLDPIMGDTVVENAGFLSEFMAPFTALFILYVGITVSQQMAPAAATAVSNIGKGLTGKMALAAGSAAFRRSGIMKIGDNLRKRGEGGWVKQEDRTRLERWGAKIPGMRNLGAAMNRPGLENRKSILEEEMKTLYDKKDKTKEEDVELADKTREASLINTELQKSAPGDAAKRIAGIARFGSKIAATGIDIGPGKVHELMEAKDEQGEKEGEAEATGKNSRTNATKMNQEFMKGPLTDWNRIIGLLNATVKNGDSDDLGDYLRDGIISYKMVGRAMMRAQRMGPPAYRPLFQAFAGDMLKQPEKFGKEFQRDGTNTTKNGSPAFHNKWVEHAVDEIPEKLDKGKITSGILGDAIDAGKAGGTAFSQELVEHLIRRRGGDLASELMRTPQTIEGRQKMAQVINNYITENHKDIDATTLRSLGTALTSPGAATAGTILTIKYPDTHKDSGKTISFQDVRSNLVEILNGTMTGHEGDADGGAASRATTPPPRKPRATGTTVDSGTGDSSDG
jgi:hypothetical protein